MSSIKHPARKQLGSNAKILDELYDIEEDIRQIGDDELDSIFAYPSDYTYSDYKRENEQYNKNLMRLKELAGKLSILSEIDEEHFGEL